MHRQKPSARLPGRPLQHAVQGTVGGAEELPERLRIRVQEVETKRTDVHEDYGCLRADPRGDQTAVLMMFTQTGGQSFARPSSAPVRTDAAAVEPFSHLAKIVRLLGSAYPHTFYLSSIHTSVSASACNAHYLSLLTIRF